LILLTCPYVLKGLLVRAWATGYLTREVIESASVEKTAKLQTDGPYSVMRHPLYVGTLFITCSLGCLLNTWGCAWLVLMALFRGIRLTSFEEVQLRKMFPEYQDYAK
jgi:protein-S-isoprenylcysteine O-methyltransferase Ste14